MEKKGAVLLGPVSLINGEDREGTVLLQVMLKTGRAGETIFRFSLVRFPRCGSFILSG